MNIAMEHERHQLCVGQGGFHYGEVRVGTPRFRYVYDCGSSNRDALHRELATFRETHDERMLDLVVLSHLDDDHVNGLETLFSSFDASVVIIPYLSTNERLLLVAQSVATGTLTESRWELLEDPDAWLRARGASEVLQVLPSSDEPPPYENENGDLRDGQEPTVRLQVDESRRATPSEIAGHVNLTPQAGVLKSGEPLRLRSATTPRRTAYWEFIPFWHPDVERAHAFRLALLKHFKISSSARAKTTIHKLRDLLRNKDQRAALKELFETHMWSDHNLSSLSLYAGPCVTAGTCYWSARARRRLRNFTDHDFFEGNWWSRCDRPGWLGTGDSKLLPKIRGRRFEEHFRSVLPRVGSFTLPHHGSKLSFGAHLFQEQLKPMVWCASAGRNSYGHPDKALALAVERRGDFVHVSERAGSTLSEYIRWQR